MSAPPNPRPATLCVHGPRALGAAPAAGAPLVGPLERSTIFALDDGAYAARRAGESDRGRVYAREANPGVLRVEEHLASLEGAERALLFASGMAALHAVLLGCVEGGQRVLVARQVYGGSFALLRELLPRLDVAWGDVDLEDAEDLERALDGDVRLLLCESISNPLGLVADLPRLAERLRERAPRALLVVDATLATPLGQRPLALGADLVFHSASKYLGGHSDLIGGVVAGAWERLKPLWRWRTLAGACADPAAAWLLERGLRTLALRTAAQAEGALRLARFLEGHPAVRAVHHCGLPSHRTHERARTLLTRTGGVLAFEHVGGDDPALVTIRRLHLFAEAASFGGVESLASMPKDLSQAELTPEQRARAGVGPGLVRLSVGVEDPRDLEADLAQALA